MEIVHANKGYYLHIDMAGVGFAESIWYETEEDLARAVMENKIVWKTWFPALEIGGEKGNVQ